MLPSRDVNSPRGHRLSVTRRLRSAVLSIETLEGRKLLSGATISVVAGNGIGGYSGNGGPATSAEVNLPLGVALDALGDIFIADNANNVIREVVESSSVATALGAKVGDIITVAGNSTQGYNTGIGEPATEAELYDPTSVAVDPAGDLFITSASEVLEVVEFD